MPQFLELTAQDVQRCNVRQAPENLAVNFNRDVRNHQMTVLREDGLYRHLRFATPGSNNCAFDILTWPGHLTVTGDMGTYTFSRVEDLFTYFRGGLQPEHWAKKLLNGASGGTKQVTRFNEKLFKDWLAQDFEEHADELPAEVQEAWKVQLHEELLDPASESRIYKVDHAVMILELLDLPAE